TDMEMCYDGALVMPSSYAVMDEEEMMYVEGGMNGTTKTREDRICVASFIAASAVALGRLTFKAFKLLAKTACSAVLAFFGCIGSAALLAATAYEGTLAAIASGYASRNKNYSYKCYGFGTFSLYTMVKA
ncbi:MAG: hypothetical protein NC124_17060, partial [Clostridium sp.]|nr:hypothetical protein [Clostridium sp.]